MNRRHFLRTFLISLGAAPAIAKALAATALIDPPEVAPAAARKVGPLQEETYVNISFVELPTGVNEIQLTTEDGSVDTFRARPTQSQEPQYPGSALMVARLVWKDICRVVDGREIELEKLELCVNIPRTDFNDGSMLCRIDEIVIKPPEITASWQEIES